MTSKLNRDEILRDLLRTLVSGWGHKAVADALEGITGKPTGTRSKGRSSESSKEEMKALQIAERLQLPDSKKDLIIIFAKDFDVGKALPRMSDIRAFLISHHQNAKELRSREQAFRRMLPILERMSEKGLSKVIARSQHSGPAGLDLISDAIKGAGENLRGDGLSDES